MKRFVSFLILFSMAFVFLGTSCSKTEEYKAPQVCLDAGHGGKDYGVVYNKRYEKNDTFAMVNAVQRALEKRNIGVSLTRGEDKFLSLQERSKIVNDSGAKLLVSFHRNSGKNAKGVEIWINPKNLWADRVLAENIMTNLKKTGISADRGIKTVLKSEKNENYYINTQSDIPSCLVKLGFISSDEDNKMFDDDNIEKYAESIADAIEISLDDIYGD